MKLRIDLLKFLTEEDICEEAAANTHRYNPEPLFSKTGTGSLTPVKKEKDGALPPRLFQIETLLNRCDTLGAQGNGLRYLTLS